MSTMPINSTALPSGSPPAPVDSSARQARAAEHGGAVAAQTAQAVSASQKSEASRQEIEDAVKQVNDFLKPINNSIEFQLDKDSGKTIVKVVDNVTKDVVRQFPSEEMLSIAKAIDKMKGLLVHQKA